MRKKLLVVSTLCGVFTAVAQTSDQDVPTRDQVIGDDLIVNGGSLAVGMDAVNGENFGSDTFRLKENNLRIHFDDTSGSGSFPANDWRITINDQTNGGENYFSIDDATAGTVPFKIEAGAGNNALHVDANGGNVGLGTNAPAVELHVADGDSPAIRIEQTNGNGWTPQTWDIAGNETNFFVRDVTNGSKIPFKIIPNAPNNSLYINASGNVGFNTAGPSEKIDVNGNIRSRDIIYADDQVAVGTSTPNANAALELSGATKGFLTNRLTTAELTTLQGSLTDTESGLMVYDTEVDGLQIWNGTAWMNATADDQGVDAFQLNGNNLEISLEDNAATTSVDLSPLLSDLESRVAALEAATGSGTGQVPELLNYQTVIRNASGSVIPNRGVSFRISVLESSTSGSAVYVETHNITTSSYGLVNFHIGSGNVITGAFNTIDWGANNYYLQVELDTTGGTNYQLMGATQFVSVPYALRAKTADVVNSFAGSENISRNTNELERTKAELKTTQEALEVLKRENAEIKEKLNAILKQIED